MNLIDTHCHLDFDAYDDDREQVLATCAERLAHVINIGTDAERNTASLELARQHDIVSATMGLHPTYVKKVDAEEIDAIEAQIREHADELVAIGEIGMDYHHVHEARWRDLQEDWFGRLLALADELGLPAVLHTRDAEKRALEIVEGTDVPVIQHCFNGAPALAKESVDRGYYISISTQVLYSPRVKELAEVVPLEHILLETDAPFLYKDGRNVPWHIEESAETIADIKDLSVEDVAEQTTKNAKAAFGI